MTPRLCPLALLVALMLLVPAVPACAGPKTAASGPPLEKAARSQATGAETAEVSAGKPFRWKGRAGATLEIENVNGSIEATTTSEPDAEILVELRDGGGESSGTAGVVLTQGARGVSLCVRPERPSSATCDRHWEHSSAATAEATTGESTTTTADRHWGHHGRTEHGGPRYDRGAGAKVTVRVPQGVRLVARTVNGLVHVRGVVGRVDADAVNGQVLLDGVREVRAKSVNGQVRASLAEGPLRGPVELSTVNGEVSVELPSGTDADLRADTMHGHVSMDTPGAEVRGAHVRLALGRGGHEVSLHTVHGAIRVAERRARVADSATDRALAADGTADRH
jgi:hypothetical protein